MCGICGILNHNGAPVNGSELMKMNDTMVARGPDDSGVYCNGGIGIAMRRLSIVDLSGGHQPIENEDGSLYLVLNGEIYNHIELRKDLKKIGHKFRTNSDVEVLIHLYEEYGYKAVEYLNGMFAFALWDENKQRLWLGRDRLGIKPLVYLHTNKKFSFASTIDAIVRQSEFKKEVDEDSLLLFMTLSYVPAPRSIWKDIKKLPPAHWMVIEGGKIITECYWKLEPSTRSITRDDFFEESKDILHDSIKLHGRSDVAVGAFLSGGLDSSAVTALFAEQSNHAVKTFSMDFEGKIENEGHYAEMVSERYHTEHVSYRLTAEEAMSTLDHLLGVMDEPMADSAIIPSYLLSKIANDSGLKVMLSGAGGDELFGGYYRHYHSKHDILAGVISWLPSLLNDNFYSIVPSRWRNNVLRASYSKGVSYGLNTSGINLALLDSMLLDSRKFQQALDLLSQQFSELPDLEKRWGFSYSRMLLDLNHYLVDNVLAITDKTSMASSVEARVPLLDHRLVELIFSVSPSINLSKSFYSAKKTLKSATKDKLPSAIISRSKMGFNGPIKCWVKHMRNTTSNNVLSDYVNPKILNFNSSKLDTYTNAEENLFNTYVLDSWLYKHL